MAVMSAVFEKYLENEFKDIMRMAAQNSNLIEVRPDVGQTKPYVSKYIVTYKVPTWVMKGGQLTRQNRTTVRIDIPSRTEAPRTHVVEGEIPYHTNWFQSGLVCNGVAWTVDSRMVDYLEFVLELLEFRESRTDVDSAANRDAARYWLAHKHERANFPTDTRSLKTGGDPVPQKLVLRLRK